jgi:hypothetical protein
LDRTIMSLWEEMEMSCISTSDEFQSANESRKVNIGSDVERWSPFFSQLQKKQYFVVTKWWSLCIDISLSYHLSRCQWSRRLSEKSSEEAIHNGRSTELAFVITSLQGQSKLQHPH